MNILLYLLLYYTSYLIIFDIHCDMQLFGIVYENMDDIFMNLLLYVKCMNILLLITL